MILVHKGQELKLDTQDLQSLRRCCIRNCHLAIDEWTTCPNDYFWKACIVAVASLQGQCFWADMAHNRQLHSSKNNPRDDAQTPRKSWPFWWRKASEMHIISKMISERLRLSHGGECLSLRQCDLFHFRKDTWSTHLLRSERYHLTGFYWTVIPTKRLSAGCKKRLGLFFMKGTNFMGEYTIRCCKIVLQETRGWNNSPNEETREIRRDTKLNFQFQEEFSEWEWMHCNYF